MAKTRKTRAAPPLKPKSAAAHRAAAVSEPAAEPRAASEAPITIVGVGASAGGLEAFSQLLEALPRAPGVAMVLVQHMAPHHDSALPVLLSTHTAMPVVQVTDGTQIEPNHVYVIPPNVQMEVSAGSTLELTPRPTDRTQHTPIDTFFASLAQLADVRPIAVVLSGTASDGAIGIREVKAAGGITFAQRPESAKYDGMPRAAIGTGMVDLVLNPAEIGAEIIEIARHPYVRMPRALRDEVGVRDDQLKRIFDLLRPVSGVDFRHYKLPTMRRRLLRRMALHRLTEVEPYIKLLQANPVELRGLFQDLLIHVTRFFREPESFAALAQDVFPKLIEDPQSRSADSRLGVRLRHGRRGVLAGDHARRVPAAAAIRPAHPDLRHRRERDGDRARAGRHLFGGDRCRCRAGAAAALLHEERRQLPRQQVDPRPVRLRAAGPDQGPAVLASRRGDVPQRAHLHGYGAAEEADRAVPLRVEPHGYLVLGQAETVGAQASLFSLVEKKYRIHRKKSAPGGLPTIAFPVEFRSAVHARKRNNSEAAGADKGLQGEVSRIILDRYAPAGVVVDQDHQIVQFRGQTGPFLEPAPGEASLNLLKMAREGLLYGLRTAIHQARKTKAPVRKEGLQVRTGATWRPVAVEVVPLTALGRLHYLVLFEESGRRRVDEAAPLEPRSRAKRKGKSKDSRQDDGTVTLLQRELAASREYLQSIIQELEAANEELQSANEEILSSNEELQSTNEELDTAKEELQSTNEELNTVNEELHGRNEEMSRVNSDLMNLVGSVQIAIVIVSSDLRIRRFTPMAEKVLNLIPADLDRSIGHINPNVECPNLEQLIIDCMESVAPVEREVQDRQGRWYSLRIRPYKSLENRIDGAVLALFDVDLLKRSEHRADKAQLFADAVLQTASHPMAMLASDLHVRQANAAFAALFSLNPDEVRGRLLSDLGGAPWKLDGWAGAAPEPAASLPAIIVPADPSGRWKHRLRVLGRVLASPDEPGASVVLVSVAEGSAAV